MIIFADENDENIRLDNFLTEITQFSRSKIQSAIKSGCVKVNDLIKKPAYLLRENDKIEYDIQAEENITIEPQNIPLNIVYEDENMLVVSCPSLVTYPNAFRVININSNKNRTLVDIYLKETNLKDIQSRSKLRLIGSEKLYGDEEDRNATFKLGRKI